MSATQTFSESDSRKIVAHYGVPIVEGLFTPDIDGLAKCAASLGFPVVLKANGAKLAHKSERGLVKVNISDEEALMRAASAMEAEAGSDMDGFLVQPMVGGAREFVAGIFRDRIFGPVVLFGLGGVLTEALDTVVMRVAPLDRSDAEEMLDEFTAPKLLGPFRGEAAVDREGLIDILLGLSRLSLERPDISEVDLNPIKVTPDGSLLAVDALVVVGGEGEAVQRREKVEPKELGKIFHPKSVAFIGASNTFGKWGQTLPANLLAGGYKGEAYYVNPRGGEMWGQPVYKSVGEIPGEVELAVVTVPASKVVDLVDQCAAKGIHYMLVITSDFSEVGEEGAALERELVERARKAGVLIFGPNTMGIQNPHADLYLTGVHVRPLPGSTTLVSQSGNMGVQLLTFAQRQGLGIRAFGGSGNEAMISVEDFLDGFEVDEMTHTVLIYLESVKDGRRFIDSAKRVGKKKPVIILKGGRTEAGSRAAASHTGALASDNRVFEAACRQAGIVSVSQPVEMLDASAVFSSLPRARGSRVAVMTLGGGWGVVTSDLCNECGLELPPLSQEVIETIDKLLPPYWSRSNPVDMVGDPSPELPFKILEALASWEGCDAVIHLGIFGFNQLAHSLADSTKRMDPGADVEFIDGLCSFADEREKKFLEFSVALSTQFGKPIIGVGMMGAGDERTLHEVEGFEHRGVIFPSPERAVRALAHMADYSKFNF